MTQKQTYIESWLDETHEGVRYGLEGKVLVEEKSSFQKITIFDSKRYGKSLLLDNCWMTAELQEKHYHECLVHPALCSAEKISKVLIIGGGDGGTAKECLKYKEVEEIHLVEIDNRVIELSKKYLPNIGGQAWRDSRVQITIQDGISWVSNAKDNSYDIILIDGSDPKGPAKGLFNKRFFQNCKRILKRGGVFATQSESPEAFRKIHIDTIKTIRTVFDFADPLYGSVPMYPSGWWSWTFAALDKERYKQPILQRATEINKSCEIWNTRWQKAAFGAMPTFIEKALKNEQ